MNRLAEYQQLRQLYNTVPRNPTSRQAGVLLDRLDAAWNALGTEARLHWRSPVTVGLTKSRDSDRDI